MQVPHQLSERDTGIATSRALWEIEERMGRGSAPELPTLAQQEGIGARRLRGGRSKHLQDPEEPISSPTTSGALGTLFGGEALAEPSKNRGLRGAQLGPAYERLAYGGEVIGLAAKLRINGGRLDAGHRGAHRLEREESGRRRFRKRPSVGGRQGLSQAQHQAIPLADLEQAFERLPMRDGDAPIGGHADQSPRSEREGRAPVYTLEMQGAVCARTVEADQDPANRRRA